MTLAAAIYDFLSKYGLPVYEETSVPTGGDAPDFPYMTYSLVAGYWGDGEQPLTVNLWYRTSSNVEPNAKAQQIGDDIGEGGCQIPYDGGVVWIKRGTPPWQSVPNESDRSIKRRYINLILEF